MPLGLGWWDTKSPDHQFINASSGYRNASLASGVALELLQHDTSLDLLATNSWPSRDTNCWPSASTSGLQPSPPVLTHEPVRLSPKVFTTFAGRTKWQRKKNEEKVSHAEMEADTRVVARLETGSQAWLVACSLAIAAAMRTLHLPPQVGLRLHAIITPLFINLGTHCSLITIIQTWLNISSSTMNCKVI